MRPCMRACPVGAISKDEYSRAVIDYSKCISCGACVAGCPFGAITDRSSIVDVINAIRNGEKVIATFAPAIEGHFGMANVGMLKSAIRGYKTRLQPVTKTVTAFFILFVFLLAEGAQILSLAVPSQT